MHGATLIVLVILVLIFGGITLGAYLVAADKLYSKDKDLTTPHPKGKTNAEVKGETPAASVQGQAESNTGAGDKRQ
ncbi:MAG TPA: hypothetical protein VI455_15270 [Terriglobia bacterium]